MEGSNNEGRKIQQEEGRADENRTWKEELKLRTDGSYRRQ